MSATKQVAVVVGMNTRAIQSRAVASMVIVLGMAAVVAVALAIYSMSAGLSNMTTNTAAPDRIVIHGEGALGGGGGGGSIARDITTSIADLPGIKKGPDGKPLIAGEINGSYLARKKDTGLDVSISFRGTNLNIFDMRPDMKLIEGRMYTPGLREAVVGQGASEAFVGLTLGKEILLADGPWKVVGIMSTATGNLYNYQLMTDVETLMASLRRTALSNIYVRLEEGTQSAREQFIATIDNTPGLAVDAESEADYRGRQFGNTSRFYQTLSYWVGGIMALGVIFAALNTMYTAVSARTTEIATLRAIGFSAIPVMISVVVEAVALAVIGAIIGAVVAWAVFNGHDQQFSNVEIDLTITPLMMLIGVSTSLLVGLIGALFPAIRAARLPVTAALQAR